MEQNSLGSHMDDGTAIKYCASGHEKNLPWFSTGSKWEKMGQINRNVHTVNHYNFSLKGANVET